MNSPFNKVLLYKNTKTLKTPENLIICESEEQYNQLLANDTEGLVELIGGESQQIKPILDIDQYLVDIDINALIADINIIFPNKEIKYNRRPPRPYNGRMKYSYRLYIQDVRISYINLKQLLNDNDLFNKYSGIDKGLYISNRILYTPNTKYKYDQKFNKYYEVPQLKLMNDAELFESIKNQLGVIENDDNRENTTNGGVPIGVPITTNLDANNLNLVSLTITYTDIMKKLI